MAGSLNKVTLIGNLGADPEVRRMNDGRPVVNIRLATTERWRDKASGDMRERTEWHRVVIFNERLAETIERYVRKGSKIYIEGQLQTRKWQDQSGQDRYSTEVVIQNFGGQMIMLDGRDSGGSSFQSSQGESAQMPSSGGGALGDQGGFGNSPLDDEIPF